MPDFFPDVAGFVDDINGFIEPWMQWDNPFGDSRSGDQAWDDFAARASAEGLTLTAAQANRIAAARARLANSQGANPGQMVAANRLAGIQESTRSQFRAGGFEGQGQSQGDCGCKGTTGECQTGSGRMRTAQLYPATKVPKLYQATHQRVRGWHQAFVGSTMVAQFSRKASCNKFVRSWNEMIKHLGSAANFDIPTLTFVFNATIDGGSGAWGLQNGFDPPMHGTGGTIPPAA